MILCTFNKKTQQVIMTSFLRDLYVTIPGHGANRINGVLLDESRYVQPANGDMAEVVLGRDEFFLMPDDRAAAVLDGEAMTMPFSKLIGRAALRVSPWGRAGFFRAG